MPGYKPIYEAKQNRNCALTALGVALKELIFDNPLSRFVGATVDSTMEDFKHSIKDWYRNGGKEILINIGKVVAIAVVCVVTLGAIGVALGATWLIYAGVGAGVGIMGQLLSDMVTSAFSREFKLSSWQTYAGSGFGGAIGGALLPTLGPFGAKLGPSMAAGIGSACSTFSGQISEKFTGGENRSLSEIIKNTYFDGVLGFGLGFLHFRKMSGINKGSNNFASVFDSCMTRIENGTVRNMSSKVMLKGATSSLYDGLPGNGVTGIKQLLENNFSEQSKIVKSDFFALNPLNQLIKRYLIIKGVI